MSTVQYINTTEQLAQACLQLRGARYLALDTEFMREKTYYAQFCLIQIAAEDGIFIIDPLALDDLTPLLELLYDPALLKILHAARQDLELFYDLRGQVPAPIFDTQVAAGLLGFPDQVGYAALVEKMLKVQLDKSHTRTDWSQRPLTAQQLEYAADDVRYLLQLYPLILEQLHQRGRGSWLEQDFIALSDPSLYANEAQHSWQRISGNGRLKSQQLAVLQQLAAWREQRARQLDKPRKWIVGDDVLLILAQRQPDTLEKLKNIRNLPEAVHKSAGAQLVDCIKQARALPQSAWPEEKAQQAPSHEQELQIDALLLALKYLAASNQLSPATLAARKDIEKLVRGERDLPLLNGWRRHVVGQTLLDLLEGRAALHMRDSALQITNPA